jgi:dihydroorotate dehydrogenase (fumarate)
MGSSLSGFDALRLDSVQGRCRARDAPRRRVRAEEAQKRRAAQAGPQVFRFAPTMERDARAARRLQGRRGREDAMDLRTRYLGLDLAHPFVPGASPLSADLDSVRRLEDAGAAAIVLPSVFEEQLAREDPDAFLHDGARGSLREALLHFPSADRFALRPDEYLRHVEACRAAVACPVIASLNGTRPGRWLGYGAALQRAGAHAVELNVYAGPPSFEESGEDVEERVVEMVRTLKASVSLPVAVKLSPFHGSLPHFAGRLEEAGADGLVLFNRLYSWAFDLESQETRRQAPLSRAEDLPLRLHWLAVLSGRLRADLAVSGGVHNPVGAVRAVMAGAHVVQMVSTLLTGGPRRLREIREGVEAWMAARGHETLSRLRGSMDLEACPDPAVYERASYMLSLQSWSGRRLGRSSSAVRRVQ